MATTVKKKATPVKKTVAEKVDTVENEVATNENQEEQEKVVTNRYTVKKTEKVEKELRQFNQHDLILCRSVTAGWLGCSGKSGQYYIFENFGDQCEIEYQDLFALKQRRSPYLYSPLFVIEDDELLANPRWADIQKFYDEQIYTMDDINEVLNVPIGQFDKALKSLPKGLAKSLQVEVAKRIEDGSFDSLRKIKVIDEVFGTDFRSILAE